jgi:hypothetical protein
MVTMLVMFMLRLDRDAATHDAVVILIQFFRALANLGLDRL